MIRIRSLVMGSAAAAMVAAPLPLSAGSKPATGAKPAAGPKAPSGPIARYDMRAGTITGAGAMGRGAGGAMGMMFGGGGGNAAQHELYLRLGSARPPASGPPKADHFMPPVAKLGKSVPLLTPVTEKGPSDELPGPPEQRERPKGRMLIFWGCGEHAPKGQPVIIDFAKLAAGQVPQGLWSSTILRDWGPSLTNSKTFGRWPNEDAMGGNRQIKSDASLIGVHRIAGNYSPEINFTLAKDFMAGLRISNTIMPSGAAQLAWNAVPGATGYFATLFGGKRGPNGDSGGDMVMWSSSASRQFGGGLSDWISPAQVAPLVTSRTVLAPATTTCIVPAEVRAAAPDFRFGNLTAYGPQEDFAYPPRPANPAAAWILEWTARIRHRSQTSWLDIPGMPSGFGADSGEDSGQQQDRPRCKPRGGLLGGLGGMLGGGGSGC
jgi:hypothetical protein